MTLHPIRGRWPRPLTGATRHPNHPVTPHSGLTLGSRGLRRVHAQQYQALLAFGAPGSGKTAALAIPALLEWDGPAIATSVKTDLLAATSARRQRHGDVLVFDPFQLSSHPGHTWSPLRAARTWDGALETAWRLAAAGELDQRGVEDGDFWATLAEQHLAPLLYVAAQLDAGIERVVAWAYGPNHQTFTDALAVLSARADTAQAAFDAQAATHAVHAFQMQPYRVRTTVEASVMALLRAYRFTRVARSAQGCDITPERLLDSNTTLYLVGDAKAAKLLRPLFLTLLAEMIDAAYERANRCGGQLNTPLLLCLDDAAAVAPLPNLAEIAATAASHNIQLLSIFHDLTELRAHYRMGADATVNSHRTRMLLPLVLDRDTLAYFDVAAAPSQPRSQHHRTRRPSGTAPQLPVDHALLASGRATPVPVKLRAWFADRRLRRLALVKHPAP